MTQLSVSMTLKKKRAGTRWKIKFFMHLFLGGWDLVSRCAHYLIWYKIQLIYLNLFRQNSQTEAYFAKIISEEPFFLSCIRVSQNISSICGFLQYTYLFPALRTSWFLEKNHATWYSHNWDYWLKQPQQQRKWKLI